MPGCWICKTEFYHWSYSSPAEPCDCGMCVDDETARAMTPDEWADAKRAWIEMEQVESEELTDGEC